MEIVISSFTQIWLRIAFHTSCSITKKNNSILIFQLLAAGLFSSVYALFSLYLSLPLFSPKCC